MPYRNGNTVWNATTWTDEMIKFLRDNYQAMTNESLAKHLGLKKTICRMKLYELGLQRMGMEYWCDEQVKFLIENYKTMGDVEIMEVFKIRWPKRKGWKRNAIHQKRKRLGLHRTAKEIARIVTKNSSAGGRSFTIDKNSSSINMHPSWVAQRIAWRDPELQSEIVKHPELIEAGRALIKLNRVIKQRKKDAK